MATVKPVSPDQPDVQALIAQLDALMTRLYPAESNHLDSVDELLKGNVMFLGAYLNNELAGIGAVKLLDGYGEIKRMFVLPAYRGRGVSKALIQALEQHLVRNGTPVARLETGIHQAAALALYKKFGYVERGPFGNYEVDPLSVFMEKRLSIGD